MCSWMGWSLTLQGTSASLIKLHGTNAIQKGLNRQCREKDRNNGRSVREIEKMYVQDQLQRRENTIHSSASRAPCLESMIQAHDRLVTTAQQWKLVIYGRPSTYTDAGRSMGICVRPRSLALTRSRI